MTKTFMDTFVFAQAARRDQHQRAGALIAFRQTQASRKIRIFSLVPGLFNIQQYCCSACLSCSIRLC